MVQATELCTEYAYVEPKEDINMKLTALELISSFLNGAGVNNPHDRATHILVILQQAGYSVRQRKEQTILHKVDDMLASAGYLVTSPIRKLIHNELYQDAGEVPPHIVRERQRLAAMGVAAE